jgi:sugar phosphate isomerase/epimerase
VRLSLQLYTLRNPLASDLEGTLRSVKEIGLEYVELAGTYDRTPETWHGLLEDIGLRASGAHIGLSQVENDFDGVVSLAKTLGFKYVIVPWADPSDYADGWTAFGKRLQPIGARLREVGLQLAYHNHDFEYKNGDGLAEFYAAVPSEDLVAEVDAAWVKIGGHDPVAIIQSLSGRVPLVHLKDFDPTKTPQWRPAGQGTMDLATIIPVANEAGAEFGVIELDESPGDPLQAVRESAEFLRAQGLN